MAWAWWKSWGLQQFSRNEGGVTGEILFPEESRGMFINDLEKILNFHGWTFKKSSSKIQIENFFSRQFNVSIKGNLIQKKKSPPGIHEQILLLFVVDAFL